MAGTFEWLTSKLSGVPPPDPEAERARHRNTLREVGLALKAELKEIEEKRAVEVQVYQKLLIASQGRPASEYGKRAMAAKRTVGDYDRQIASIKARLSPIEQTLYAAQRRQTDSKLAAALAALTTAERNAPNAVTREQLSTVMNDASSLVRDTDGAERDLNAMDFSGPVDQAAFDAEFAAEYAALSAPPSTEHQAMLTAAGAAPVSAGPTEADLAAAMEASIRAPAPEWTASPVQWTPPARTQTTNPYGMQ